MKNNEEKFIKMWEEEKQKGKLKYILTLSIRNTVMIVVGAILVRYLISTFIVEASYAFKADDLYRLIILFIAILIASIIGSNYRWKNNENKYDTIRYSKD
ncbi:MAG: hypothetical protein JJT76_02165 [Clostridiaceae bacterium]|nr:hypothetical protein [Clostridiaceae bacterium]